MRLAVGTRLGAYEILAPLGAGGMGEVYRARDPRLERDVALKVLPAETLGDRTAGARLLREARMAARLNHPHVCTIHEVGEAQGRIYIAMELVEGQPLARVLAGGPMPIEQVLRYGVQVADALGHAHARGVVHRDLKSANLIITPEGRAKVLDFGLAKPMTSGEPSETTAEAGVQLTVAGAVLGTPAYMAPEQVRGRPADARSDVWALGVVLYEMAAGQRPFAGQTTLELGAAILNQPPPSLPTRVPANLRAVVNRCLEKVPEHRYQQAEEVRTALETIQGGAEVPSAGPRARWPRGLRTRRQRLLASALVVVAAMLIAVVASALRARPARDARRPAVTALAVLPFANLSADPEQDYLAAGLHEALITDVAKLSGLRRVIARPSVIRYQKDAAPLSQIARELNVDVIVTGTVLRSGDRVRVTAQLVDPFTGTQLWGERYDRDLRDVLSLQGEMVAAITREIDLQLTPVERTRMARAASASPAAYESYLRARFQLAKRTPEGLKTGLRHLQTAVEADPAYALAYVGLADAYRALASYGEMPPLEAYLRAKAALAKALAIDDDLAEAHTSRANEHYDDLAWEAAEREYRRAIQLSPNLAAAHHHYAVYLCAAGRHDSAIGEITRALELDPLSPVIRGAELGILFHARRYAQTIEAGKKTADLKPPFGYFHVGGAYIELGMREAGIAQFEQEAAVSSTPTVQARLGYALARSGRQAAALEIARELEERAKHEYVPAYEIALLFAGLRDNTRSIAWLEKALAGREGVMWLHFLEESPCFDGMRDDARFQNLLRRMNFPR